ncbi:MAG: fibronectin type III domain-containing protein, partial [Actinobacteria bacterium]|nr:fibronectin type III domain-containing protein [Actinomycetota bacterium]
FGGGGTATFGSTILSSDGTNAVFTAKMNADGTWAWATQAGGTGSGRGMGVSALPDGSSIVTGYFGGTATFGSTSLTNSANVCSYGSCATGFTAKMNADGTWAWATQAGGTGFGEGSGVSALPDGSSTATGFFSGLAIFGSTTLEGSGGTCGTWPSRYPCRDVLAVRYLDAPQAPAAPVAVAGDASAAVTITPLAGGSVTSYTVTSDSGEKTCTVVAPKTSCTVEGLTSGTSYRFRATATNASGTGAASAWSNAVTPAAAPTAAAAAVVIKGKVHCVATTCVTTGSVPAGAIRITQRATTRPSGRSATGKCAIRRTKAKRTYSCTVQLSRGTWVITTTARTQSAAMAHFSKRVQVAPRKAAVTG